MVDEDPAHRLRGDGEEVTAVLPVHPRLVDETEIRLVDERGRLERVAAALLSEVTPGELPELGVDERHQLLERRRSPAFQAIRSRVTSPGAASGRESSFMGA